MLPPLRPSISWRPPADGENPHVGATSARALLEQALERCDHGDKAYRGIARELAMCMLQDGDADAAWTILARLHDRSADRLRNTTDHASLSLASAIWYRKWQAGASVQDLRVALVYALRAARVRPSRDLGRSAVNAALILDLLAAMDDDNEVQHGGAGAYGRELRGQAAELRRTILMELGLLSSQSPADGHPNTDWGFAATLAEAHFGLGEYQRAQDRLRLAEAAEPELADTSARLAAIARLHERSGERLYRLRGFRAWRAVARVAGAPGMRSLRAGKAGIALLGSGEHAEQFHRDVIRQLTELDLLRHVEVFAGDGAAIHEIPHACPGPASAGNWRSRIKIAETVACAPDDPAARLAALTARGCEIVIVVDDGSDTPSLRSRVIETERSRLASRKRAGLLRDWLWLEKKTCQSLRQVLEDRDFLGLPKRRAVT